MAEATEIMDALESLALHCRPPLMSVDDRARWMRDWCEDLRSYDIAAIRAATAKWRSGESQKFPTPGQLLPLVRVLVGGPISDGPIGPWRPITDEAYDALSLAEKIRHQRILASEARSKAGPMWRNGRPAGPDEMTDRWRIWIERARNHDAEAARLRQIMDNARERRAEESGAA